MHTIDFFASSNHVVVYGGRNDALNKSSVLSDLWILKLCNLEWVEAKIGGTNLPVPRFNHSSVVNGSELIVCGGQGKDFNILKDIVSIELN